MHFTRREFCLGALGVGTTALLPHNSYAAARRTSLPIPPLLDTHGAPAQLEAISGATEFLSGKSTPTKGFNQPYLGPTLRFWRGSTSMMRVTNRLNEPITCHWHGLHVPGQLDGGPQLEITPGATWTPELAVSQPAATLWYHSHVHGATADQVQAGLAGMIIVEEPHGLLDSLPSDYGKDDIPLIIQDRAFRTDGSFHYVKQGPAVMMGFRADTILVNGAVQPLASPPAGIVRLRILNASNARIYHLRFSDDREFARIASDGGLLPRPVAERRLTLAPAERVELLVDFSDGRQVALLSGPDQNSPMGPAMGRMMATMFEGIMAGDPTPSPLGRAREFEIMTFAPDRNTVSRLKQIPATLPASADSDLGEPVRTRRFTLDMPMGPGGPMGGRGMRMGQGMPMGMGSLGINGRPYQLSRIDAALRRGEAEIWEIVTNEMAHPFHVHGTSFRVLSRDGKEVPYETEGMKDVTLVNGVTRILVRFDHPASEATPFMLHCHILEHEDAGMMAQVTVS